GGLMGGMPATVAAVVAGAEAGAEPDAAADGQGAADAGADAGALALAAALAAAVAQSPRADCAIVVVLPPETARTIPSVRPSAIGMARGTAIRAARLFRRRRHAEPCPLSIQSTSMWEVPCAAPGASR